MFMNVSSILILPVAILIPVSMIKCGFNEDILSVARMKPNNFAMREWHLQHTENVIARYVKGLSPDASSFERRNHKRYGSISYCIKQIEYDMKHGVEKKEVMEILRKVRLEDKYKVFRTNVEAKDRLDDLEERLSGTSKVESLLWHERAFGYKG